MNKNNCCKFLLAMCLSLLVFLCVSLYKFANEIKYTNDDLYIIRGIIMEEVELTDNHLKKYDLDMNGYISSCDYVRIKKIINNYNDK